MLRPRDLSIRAKLSAGFGLCLVLMSAIGAISLAQLWWLNTLATRVTQEWLPEMEVPGQTKRATEEHWLLAQRRNITTNFRQAAADLAKMQLGRKLRTASAASRHWRR